MRKTTRLKKPQIPELDTLYQFDDLGGRPKYGGVEMTSETDIPSFQEIMDETHSAVVAEATARDDADDALQAQIDDLSGNLSSETDDRIAADNNLQSEIDTIVAASDVKDIVGTKADLDNYDTSTLGNNDIVKVLQDETQQNQTTYYRWSTTTETFTLIGAEGPYYTKSAADALLNAKADKATTYTKTEVDDTVSGLEADIAAKQDQLTAGNNITIDANNVISAAGDNWMTLTTADYNATTHSAIAISLLTPGKYHVTLDESVTGVTYDGPNAQEQEISGDTIIVLPYDEFENRAVLHFHFEMYGGTYTWLYYYQYDNLQRTINITNVPNVVGGPGNSYADVMSQNAVTSMVFRDPNVRRKIAIGSGATTGTNANSYYTAVGASSSATGASSVALGNNATASGIYSIAFPSGTATNRGEVAFGLSVANGYNNTNYRLLTGLYDPQNDHDAATKGYVDTAVAGAGGGGGTTLYSNFHATSEGSSYVSLYTDSAMQNKVTLGGMANLPSPITIVSNYDVLRFTLREIADYYDSEFGNSRKLFASFSGTGFCIVGISYDASGQDTSDTFQINVSGQIASV